METGYRPQLHGVSRGVRVQPARLRPGVSPPGHDPAQHQQKKGDNALSPGDALSHDEWGGENGGVVLYSLHAPDGIILEYFNEDMTKTWTTSVEEFVGRWEAGSVYGWRPEAP